MFGLGVDVPEGAMETSPEAGVCISGKGTASVDELVPSITFFVPVAEPFFFDFEFLLTNRETT